MYMDRVEASSRRPLVHPIPAAKASASTPAMQPRRRRRNQIVAAPDPGRDTDTGVKSRDCIEPLRHGPKCPHDIFDGNPPACNSNIFPESKPAVLGLVRRQTLR
jgi:hypothetical protein